MKDAKRAPRFEMTPAEFVSVSKWKPAEVRLAVLAYIARGTLPTMPGFAEYVQLVGDILMQVDEYGPFEKAWYRPLLER